jgi:hypothetical protein
MAGIVGNAAANHTGRVTPAFIFETATFRSCHASILPETPNGLVAAWFGGTRERHPDVGVWVSGRVEGKWSVPVEVASGIQPDGSRLPCWNPVLFQAQQGPLLLLYKIGLDPRGWWGMLRTSADGGKTWSEPHRLLDLLGEQNRFLPNEPERYSFASRWVSGSVDVMTLASPDGDAAASTLGGTAIANNAPWQAHWTPANPRSMPDHGAAGFRDRCQDFRPLNKE